MIFQESSEVTVQVIFDAGPRVDGGRCHIRRKLLLGSECQFLGLATQVLQPRNTGKIPRSVTGALVTVGFVLRLPDISAETRETNKLLSSSAGACCLVPINAPEHPKSHEQLEYRAFLFAFSPTHHTT
jgi:hypothetical protein